MKDDGGAQLRAESRHRLADDVASLRPVVVPAVRGDVEAGGQEPGQLLAAEVGDREVDPDPAQPGAGRGGRGIAMAGAVRAHERLLGEVLSRRGIQDDSSNRTVDREVLLVVQLLELRGRIELFRLANTGIHATALGHAISLKLLLDAY